MLEEDCKERVGRHGGLKVVADAVARFAEEAELVIPAFDVLLYCFFFVSSWSIETIPYQGFSSEVLIPRCSTQLSTRW